MWGRFFESLGEGDTESVISGSTFPSELHSRHNMSRSMSQLVGSPRSDARFSDTASNMDDESASQVGGFASSRNGEAFPTIQGPLSPPAVIDDGTYVFKFRTPSGRTHRFQARHDNFENIRDIVSGKLATDPFFTNYKISDPSELPPDPSDFLLSYTDADGDIVLITSDSDVTDAVKNARKAGLDRVVLFIQGGKGWADVTAEKSAQQAAVVAEAAKEELKEVEKVEVVVPPEATNLPLPRPVHVQPPEEEKVIGIPKDLLLPASIGALAAVILGVFTISRLSAR